MLGAAAVLRRVRRPMTRQASCVSSSTTAIFQPKGGVAGLRDSVVPVLRAHWFYAVGAGGEGVGLGPDRDCHQWGWGNCSYR